MATPILLPRLGASMTHGTFVEWLVNDGEAVAVGDELYVVATDKVDSTVEATASGVLFAQAEPDEEYEVGAKLGEIL